MNFFALLEGTRAEDAPDDADTPLRIARIPLEQSLQKDVTQLFKKQEDDFFAERLKEIAFSPSHTPDESEVAFIDDFPLPEVVVDALTNPLEQETLKLNAKAFPKIKGIFGGEGESQPVCFQAFERRQFLDSSGFSLLLSRGTFKRLSDPGLTLDTKLAAVYRGTRLFFANFFVARRVLDLSTYFQEATDADIARFAKEPHVKLESATTLTDNADQWVRRRIALIRKSKVMTAVPVVKIVREATSYGVTVRTRKVNGKQQILFPDDKQELKELLRFLDENYYTSGLTGSKWVANSKSPVPAAARKAKKGGKRSATP